MFRLLCMIWQLWFVLVCFPLFLFACESTEVWFLSGQLAITFVMVLKNLFIIIVYD